MGHKRLPKASPSLSLDQHNSGGSAFKNNQIPVSPQRQSEPFPQRLSFNYSNLVGYTEETRMFATQIETEAKKGTNYSNKHIYFHITIISK